MAEDMWTIINRELAKQEQARAGVPDTSYAGVFKQAMEYGTQQREWNERKNLQRQKMMALGTEGWEESTDVDSLAKQSDWLGKYLNKNQGNMDDITLEYADLLKEQIGNRNQRIVNLHTDSDMLEQSKEQWLGIADDLKDRPLGQEDYNDLSSAIGQYTKMKQDMLENNADFLALPQFEYIKQDMIGQEYVINEILREAKDQNVFSETEYDWTTTALRDGNYTMLAEKKQERINDHKRTMDDLSGQIDIKMDLHRRIQTIKDGGIAFLPEIIGDSTSMIGLADLGFEQLPSGEWVPEAPEGKAFGRGETEKSKELEGLRSDWSLLAGAGNIEGSAERDIKNLDLAYERESGTGNKYTIGKIGFENFYADPSKPAETTDGNYSDVSDEDGFINVDKAIDTGFSTVDVVGIGVAGAGVAAYNWDKIDRTWKSAHKFMDEVGFLSEDEIAKMFVDKDAKNIMSSIDKQMTKLNAIDRTANPAEYKKALEELTAVQTSAKNKLFPKFSGELIKAQKSASVDLTRAQLLLEDITKGKLPATDPEYLTPKEAQNMVAEARKEVDRLTGKLNKRNKGMTDLLKNPNKWNLWKMKTGLGLRQTGRTVKDLAKIGGKTFAKLTPLDAAMWGWYIGDMAGLQTYTKVAASGGAYMGAKQVMNWLSRKGGLTNALMNPTLQSKIGGYLIKKAPWLASKMGLKAGAGIAGTAFTGGLGTAFGLAMAAWTGKDIYNLIQDVPEIKQYVIEYLRGDYGEFEKTREKGMTAVGQPGLLPK